MIFSLTSVVSASTLTKCHPVAGTPVGVVTAMLVTVIVFVGPNPVLVWYSAGLMHDGVGFPSPSIGGVVSGQPIPV